MVIGIRDSIKLIGISSIACCAVFVCTLFLNYNIDLVAIEGQIVTQASMIMYDAHVSMGKITVAVTGGCLIITSIIMLLFYVKNYIDTHGKELGILKALGYSNIKITKHFWIFGLSVLTGCALGFVFAFLYLPTFYELQNAEGLFPDMPVDFHPLLAFLLIVVPAMLFAVISVFYAYCRLKKPALDLLREKIEYKNKIDKKESKDLSFLKDLKKITVKSKNSLVFFVAFSAFCFSAMMQMSVSMGKMASETFAIMIMIIGLIIAFIILFLSLSSVIRGNIKTIAMMRVFGYEYSACSKSILGGYRLISYIGFVLGTVYQYVLMKFMMTVVFADIKNFYKYSFDYEVLAITLVAFIITYELIMYSYSLRIKKLSIKSIMLE